MSKNNFDERLRKMEPKKDHFSIRKFSVGVASVLIGFSFLGLANSQVIKADSTSEPQAVQAKQSVSASGQQKAVAQSSQKQLDQGNVPANDSQTKQTLTSIQAAAVQAMQKQQAAEIARQNSRLPEDQKPAKKIDAGVGLAGRKEVQGAVKGLADQIDKTAGSDTQTVKDNSQKNPAVVVDKKDDTAKEATVKPDLPAEQTADEKVKVDKKNQEYQTITLEDLSASDQNALAKSLGMSLEQLQTEVAANASGIVVPASEWLGDASWRYQTINMQTGVLKANTDTDLPFKIISKIKGGDVAHNRDYELRIQLDHRLDPYVSGIKVSRQGDVNDKNISQKSMTKNADGSWSLPLFALHGGVMGLANVDVPWTNPNCEIDFNDQIDNFYQNLGDLRNNPLQYAIYGYDKKTGKVIGDYKSTGYVISQESLFNQPVATGKDANRAGNTNQPYYQGAALTLRYDKDTNTINALYNPSMLSAWSWDSLAKSKINSLNYQVDPRLVPYIDHVTLINYKSGLTVYPFKDDGTPKEMKISGQPITLTIGKAGTTYVGQGKIEVTGSNMSIDGVPRSNHYVGLAFHLNKALGQVINGLALEEKANSRLMFGVYFTAKNGKMAPNTLATNAFDIDKLGQADNYQPEYTAVTVTKGDGTSPAVSDTSHLSWEDNHGPKDNPTYSVKADPQFTFGTDENTGNILVTPKDQTSVGMHNMLVTVTYSDGTVDQVYVPIYVKDLHHDVVWGKDSNNKTTGAVEVITYPQAHETSGNSQVLTPNNFVSEINQYKIAKDGKAVPAGAIDKSTVHFSWTGSTLNTQVPTASMRGKNITGTISIDLSNVSGIDQILGTKPKTIDKSINFAPVGAVAQNGAFITISNGKQPTSEQLETLIDHSNLDGLPKSMAVDQYELKPGTTLKVGTNNVTVRIIFKDKDSQGNQTYLDVNVPAGIKVTTNTTDADQYQATYQPRTGHPGERVTFANPSVTDADGNKLPSNVKPIFTTADNTPSWVSSISSDGGSIVINHAPAIGYYSIPVKVTYNDNSSEITYAYLAVVDKDTNVVWNGDSATSMYRSSVNNYHKTNDGSAHDTEIAKDLPTINKIARTNFETKDHQPETIVYVRQSDGSYKLVSGAGFKDANGDIAPATIAAGQITSVWKTGFEGNSDASNFPQTGTGTSLAKDQWNNPGGEQQQTTGKMAGNSKAIMLGHFGTDAEKILGVKNSDDFWFNVYSNYYGAKATDTVPTFKQNQDISNLTQDQYRQLVDVTDLGQNGWNGTNINPDAPQILAYVPGTNSGKKFYMTWAPGKEASTAKVADGVDGTVRIHFGDGTYLDLAVKINVKADQDSGKPDHDKTEFTQKIVYTYNGQEVAYTTIDNIPKGSNLSADTLKNAIDSNVPANYTIQAGYTYPAAIANIQATPVIIYVPLTHNTNDRFNANGQIVYQTADGKEVAKGRKISSHLGDTLTAGLLKDWADEGMTENTLLKGYVIAQYPASYDVTSKEFTITVIVKAGTEVINPTNPKDPNQNDLFKDVTRTINVHNPNGTDDITKQVVHFDRTKTINAVTHEVISYGDWQLMAGSAKDWAEFTAPAINGYTADPSSVAEKSVNANTKNETVDIYYTKNNNGGGNTQPTQPSQPTQPNPGSTPQTSNPAPAQPTTPSPEPKPEPQPTNPDNGGQKSNPGTNNKPKATNNGNQGHHAQGGQNAGKKSGYAKQGTAKAGENGLNDNALAQKAPGNGNNGSEAAQNNASGKGAKRLPQTGEKQNNASIFGLALASLAGLFGLAGDRKRSKR